MANGYFLRADRRLFLQWRRSAATDAANSRPVGIRRRTARDLLASRRSSIPMPAICACGPFRPATATKLPISFGWCRIRYISSAFRRLLFPPPCLVPRSDNQTLIRKVIEAQCELLRVANRGDDFAGCAGAAARVATNALRQGKHLQLAETVGHAGVLSLAQHDAGPLLAALEQALVDLAVERSPVIDGGGDRPAAATGQRH